MAGGRGGALEALVVQSTKNHEAWQMTVVQTSPRFVPSKFLPNGLAMGRIVGRGWLDFFGYLRGRFLTFDAKSNERKTLFPLDSLHPHQVSIMAQAHNAGCIAFFLVEFASLQPRRYFALTWPILARYWRAYLLDDRRRGRASIPLETFISACPEIKVKAGRLDIISFLDEWRPENDAVPLP